MKPTLRFMAHQPTLRKMFKMTAALLYRKLPGCTLEKVDLGGVETLKITPPGVTPSTCKLLYFHGGAFTIGGADTHKWMAARIALEAGIEVWLPNYSLAPEHKFPSAHQDAEATFDALSKSGDVVVGGDSAGGHLCLSLLATGRRPKAMTLLSPLAEIRHVSETELDFSKERLLPIQWVKRAHTALLKGANTNDPRMAPLNADLSNAPPILVQSVKEEALAFDTKRILQAVPSAEMDWTTGVPHVWQLHAGWSKTADASVARLGQFIRAQI